MVGQLPENTDNFRQELRKKLLATTTALSMKHGGKRIAGSDTRSDAHV
jgi:hypothetical protein